MTATTTAVIHLPLSGAYGFLKTSSIRPLLPPPDGTFANGYPRSGQYSGAVGPSPKQRSLPAAMSNRPDGFCLRELRTCWPLADKYRGDRNPIDASSVMANGQEISDIVEFKKMLKDRKYLVISCLTKMLTYATGRHLEAVDRGEVDSNVAELGKKDNRLRDLIHLV